MSTHQQTLEWIRKLGYDGEFPESFHKICNNSTSFIWDQLIQNVRSKNEVDNIKSNILVNSLKQTDLNSDKSYKSQCSSEDVSTYLKKRDLEQTIAKINYSISEKQAMHRSLIQQNSIKQFTIEKIKLKIKENEEREYLLRQKMKVLDTHILEAENIHKFSMTCAPAEVNETHNPDDITNTLNECKGLLEEKIKQLPLSGRNMSYRPLLSAHKSSKKNNTFEHYLCLTEKQTAKKIKKVVPKTGSSSTHKVNIRLFPADCNTIKTKSNRFIDMSNKRESLEMHIEDNDDENFLVDQSKASFLPTLPSFKHSFSSMPDMSRSTTNGQINNETMLKMVHKDAVSSEITHLLHKYSRPSILNIFRYLDDDIHFHISKKINFRDIKISNDGRQKSVELAKLQALHIKTEFKLVKNNFVLKQLINNVNKKNESLNSSLLNFGYPSNLVDSLQKKLQLHAEDAGLDCLLIVMKREINDTQNSSKMTDIHELNKSLKEIKEEVTSKINGLSHYLTLIQEIFTAIHRIRNTSSACVREVAPFTSDLTWCYLLQENINSNEIKIFEQFPLEYNKKFIKTNPCLYYRDIHTDKYLLNQEVDNENLSMLSSILGNPFSPPETVMFNILCSKLKLDALKKLKPVENRIPFKKHSLKDLQSKECTVEAVEQLNKLICSSTSKKTLSAADVSTKVMNMWSEMNFNQFISQKIKVDGKDYQHFEMMYDRFFNGL